MHKETTSLLNSLMVLVFISMVAAACSDEGLFLTPRYANPDDKLTSSIQVNIPRITHSRTSAQDLLYSAYVSVNNQQNNMISSLVAQNFKVNLSCEQTGNTCLETFRVRMETERIPLVVGITMDYSGSMSDISIVYMEEAVRHFVRMLSPADYVQIIKFSSSVEVVNPFTNDFDQIMDAVNSPFSDRSSTAFWNSVYLGLENAHAFAAAHGSLVFPCIIAFTDGYNNVQPVSLYDIVDSARKKQIPVYSIGFGQVDKASMDVMARYSGGVFFHTDHAQDLESVFGIVSAQINGLYRVDFETADPGCSKLDITIDVSYESGLGLNKASITKPYYFP